MSGETIKIEFELPKELFLKGRDLTQTVIKAEALKRLAATAGEKQVAYRPVVVASLDIEANSALTPQNLEVRNVPVTAVPEEVLAAIPSGKLAGQKIWNGEHLLPPMVKDNPVAQPEPDNRVFYSHKPKDSSRHPAGRPGG